MSADQESEELLKEYSGLFKLRREGYARLVSEMEKLLPVLPSIVSEADLKVYSRLLMVFGKATLFLCRDAQATNDLLESALRSSIVTKDHSVTLRRVVENLAMQLEIVDGRLSGKETPQKERVHDSRYM